MKKLIEKLKEYYRSFITNKNLSTVHFFFLLDFSNHLNKVSFTYRHKPTVITTNAVG